MEVDRIRVHGVDRNETTRVRRLVLVMNKPRGYVTTRSDPQGRPTVYDLLPPLDRFVFPVGRLDLDTTGLLILTDDHQLGERLTNPDSHVPKTYRARVRPVPDDAGLRALRRGLPIGRGEVTRPARVQTIEQEADEATIDLTIDEGKNRQIRRMMAAIGVAVVELERIAIGSLRVPDLALRDVRRLLPSEVARLYGRS